MRLRQVVILPRTKLDRVEARPQPFSLRVGAEHQLEGEGEGDAEVRLNPLSARAFRKIQGRSPPIL